MPKLKLGNERTRRIISLVRQNPFMQEYLKGKIDAAPDINTNRRLPHALLKINSNRETSEFKLPLLFQHWRKEMESQYIILNKPKTICNLVGNKQITSCMRPFLGIRMRLLTVWESSLLGHFLNFWLWLFDEEFPARSMDA